MDSALLELERVYEGAVATDAAIEVFCWRLEELARAGYSRATAEALAERPEVDLHAACRLLGRGCDELTAFRILV